MRGQQCRSPVQTAPLRCTAARVRGIVLGPREVCGPRRHHFKEHKRKWSCCPRLCQQTVFVRKVVITVGPYVRRGAAYGDGGTNCPPQEAQ